MFYQAVTRSHFLIIAFYFSINCYVRTFDTTLGTSFLHKSFFLFFLSPQIVFFFSKISILKHFSRNIFEKENYCNLKFILMPYVDLTNCQIACIETKKIFELRAALPFSLSFIISFDVSVSSNLFLPQVFQNGSHTY